MIGTDHRDDTPKKTAGHVLLVYPYTGIDVPGISVFLPLSVLSLVPGLEAAGFSVEIIDMRVTPNWKHSIISSARHGLLYVGISAMTGKQIFWGMKVAAMMRRIDGSIPIVWGGTHASVLPAETLRHPLVDAVVTGDGRESAVEIARRRAAGEEVAKKIFSAQPPRAGVQSVGERPFDLSKICVLHYLTPVVRGVRGLALVTSRGCPHHCAYCYNKAVHHNCWIADPAEAVVDNLARLSALGVRGAMIFDDNFFVSRRRVEAVAEGILVRRLKLSIKADCRADTLVRYSNNFLSLLRRAGFEMLYIGAESGSDRVLGSVQKGLDVAALHRANLKLAAVGIRPHYSFMAGLPGETVEEMYATIQMMRRLKQEHPGAYLSPVKAYVPYPGTPLFGKAIASGFQAPDSLEGWSTYEWNNRPSFGIDKVKARYVEKMTYVTAGLDPSIAELSGIDQGRFTKWGFSHFSKLCQKRCECPDLGRIPELRIVRLAKRIVSS